MTDELPKPASRKEEYLAKAAGMDDITLPEPASREELYLNAIAENGGGGGGGTSYRAGDGINISNHVISVDTTTIQPKLTEGTGIDINNSAISVDTATIQPKLTAGTGIDITDNTISATGGGGDTVYSDKSTSNSSTGGAVYIGNLDSSQTEQADPTTTDNHYKYFWALPSSNSYIPEDGSINILGERARNRSIVIGNNASDTSNTTGNSNILIGNGNYATGAAYRNVALGEGAVIGSGGGDNVSIGTSARSDNYVSRSVALGSHAIATRNGEVNVGNTNGSGYNNTNYRVLGGVHDGQLAQDAVTVNQVNNVIDAINTALNTNIPHIGAAS